MGVGHPGDPQLVHGHVLSDFHKADLVWLEPMLRAVADAVPFALAGDDERYQAEVMRLAPAAKFSPRQTAQNAARSED
jgi:PTH1 family peptidyl-tRNA hydrolase